MPKDNAENKGLALIKKGRKGLIHAVFSRLGLFAVLLALQFLVLFCVFCWFGELLPHYLGGTVLLTVAMVLYLINSRLDPTAKITWLIVVMLIPIFGVFFFWFTQSELGHRMENRRINQLIRQTRPLLPQQPEPQERLRAQAPAAARLADYINRNGCHPVYMHTAVTYFPTGEDKWQEMLRQLEAATDFIFLEYFIIDEGLMWGKVLEILARKAAAGVDVRVMYDGTCEFSTLPHDYPKQLKKLGISCRVFSPIVPLISTHYNYRDHRKILVIDGHTAFTGGINLADEYIHRKNRFGDWKDTAVMLKGEAVKSFTLLFLQLWSIPEKEPVFDRFLEVPVPLPATDRGFVLPFGDCPLDSDKVGERVYMDILNRATKYVHIFSPYLIIDGELETALKFAAERGVEVQLILPGIPDKRAPYALAKTHYSSLLDSGVQIYEYTPGFVHAKVFVSDDREAVVGTINLDYRSLYHHFECATWMYDVPCITEIESDFEKTLSACRRVEKNTVWDHYRALRPLGYVLKAIAPLL